MPTNKVQWSAEKRAYYRLLRHLLSDELKAHYNEDQAQPLSPRMAELIETLKKREPSKTH